jgi:hypothetical protein
MVVGTQLTSHDRKGAATGGDVISFFLSRVFGPLAV